MLSEAIKSLYVKKKINFNSKGFEFIFREYRVTVGIFNNRCIICANACTIYSIASHIVTLHLSFLGCFSLPRFNPFMTEADII